MGPGNALALATIRKNKAQLDPLLEQANALHAKVVDSMRLGVKTAFEVGKVLSEIKAILPHGHYESWIEENADFSLSTARTYKSLFDHEDELIEDHGTEVYLKPISGIMKLIKGPTQGGKSAEAADLKAQEPPPVDGRQPVDGTDECPHGGPHEFDEDHACRRCHDPEPGYEIPADVPGEGAEPDDDGPRPSPGDQGQVGAGKSPEQVAQRKLCDLFDTANKHFGELIRTLDQINTASPMKRRADMIASMECLYGDFRLERKEKRAWRTK